MEFLEVFNAFAREGKAVRNEFKPATSYDDPINEDVLNLDSLDVTLTYAMLADVYMIPQELEDQWPYESVGALRDFIEANKQQDPTDRFDSVKALVKEFK